MKVIINKLYEKVRKNREGQDVVSALFYWDGEDRCVPVPVNVHKVGDEIEVHLMEVYSKEKGQGFKWWEYKGACR